MKQVKKKISILSVVLLISVIGYSQVDPFEGINDTVSDWKSSMLTLYDTLMVIGILIGGIVLYFKMKSAEGSEGKKAALNFFAAVIIAVLVRGLISLFGG